MCQEIQAEKFLMAPVSGTNSFYNKRKWEPFPDGVCLSLPNMISLPDPSKGNHSPRKKIKKKLSVCLTNSAVLKIPLH